MGTLELKNLAKRYGAVSVIEDLSLSIDQGQFVVLVGPSGCGKSTVLRMIAGLEPISGGDLLIDGKRANDIPPQKRDISMVFQSYALFPHMTVRDNIAFGPEVRREDKAETDKRIAKASEVLNLTDYLDRLPGQLSGGQRQRVAMGRAIVRDPSLFLFDEPLSNLDAKLRVQMRAEIKALHQKLNTTIVYVTHDQIEAMTMADVIVVMKDGEIMQTGAPLEIYDHPNNAFVAGFIGSPAMGFIHCSYDSKAKSAVLPNGKSIGINAGKAKNGQELQIGIRPENFVRDPKGPIEMQVEVVEPTGSEIHVVGFVGENEVRAVFRDRILPKMGETITLSAAPELIHVFDLKTGERV